MDADSVGSAVAEGAHQAGAGVVGDFKKLGKSMFAQLLGKSDNENLKHGEIKNLAKADDKFSEVAVAEQQARIKAVYEEYYARKKKQEQMEQQRGKQEEEAEKMEELNEKRMAATEKTPSVQIAKTRAKIGKNFGQE